MFGVSSSIHGLVTRMTVLSRTCRSTWHPTPQYGHTERTTRSGLSTCSFVNRSSGSTSWIAPVGHTRTHSPHHVHAAWSGSPSPPTTISACSPRIATSSTPTCWMSAQARTQRVHRMHVLMSWPAMCCVSPMAHSVLVFGPLA